MWDQIAVASGCLLARGLRSSYRDRVVMSLPSSVRSVGLVALLLLGSCATEELTLPEENGGGTPAAGGTSGTASVGGKPSSGSPATAGSGAGGSKPSAGSSNGGSASGGSSAGSTSLGGSAGKASGGSGGKAGSGGSGGKATGGSAGTGGSSAGSGPIGTGSCADTPAFVLNTKYALNAKVFASCSGGTPCTSAMPPLANGKSYEFKCLDEFNCGGQNPGTTNWSQPPWAVTQACE